MKWLVANELAPEPQPDIAICSECGGRFSLMKCLTEEEGYLTILFVLFVKMVAVLMIMIIVQNNYKSIEIINLSNLGSVKCGSISEYWRYNLF